MLVAAACTLLVALIGLYVLTPLFREPKGNLDVELLAETELDRLLNRKAVIYSNIKDLEFEYKMGRLSDADYGRLGAGYKAEAALVLQKLDQLGAEKNVDEQIEKEISVRRGKLSSAPPSQSAPGFASCPSCGSATVPGKKFCADCGQRLA